MPMRPPSLVPATRAPKQPNAAHAFYGTQAWKQQRDRIKKRDGWQCTYPGCRTKNRGRGGRLIVNHLIPRGTPGATGGDHECATFCAACDNRWHKEKGHKAHAD